jgi:hypothetical protein
MTAAICTTRSLILGIPRGRCLPIGFGYPHPTHGLRLVGLLLEFFRQFPQPPFHALRFNLRETLAISTRGATIASAALPGM